MAQPESPAGSAPASTSSASTAQVTRERVEQMRTIVRRSASRWKRLLLLEALALAVAAPLAYLWLVFLLDNLVHLPMWGRVLANLVFLAGFGWLVASLVRRW